MSSTGGHIRMLVILVLFLAILTIASIILSVVSITSWGKKDSPGDYDHYKNYYYNNQGKDGAKTPYHPYAPQPYYPQSPPVVITNSVSDSAASKLDDCYTISFSEDWYHHEFIDEDDKCALKGWGPAIALAACAAANLKCKIVYTPWQQCIDYFKYDEYAKHPVLGEGLAHHTIDACGGWFPDQERFNVAGFTDGWTKNPKVYLFYRTSTGVPAGTDIGFAYATPWNEKCLKRYLKRLSITSYNLVSYKNEGELHSDLIAGTIDWAFLSDLTADVPGGFTGITKGHPTEPMKCAEGGAGLVTRKREFDFIEKFNKGLGNINHNGVLKELCNSVTSASHGSDLGPDQYGQWCAGTVYA